jgi:predicted secreted protein
MKKLLFALLLIPVLAQSQENESQYNRVHLSASAQTELANDTIIVNLYAEEEGSRPAQLADVVNKKILWAVALLKKHPKIKLQTSAYTTSPVYQKKLIKSWRLRQSIRLESREMTETSELLGELQTRLALQSMRFTVSPELKASTDDTLIAEALTAFGKRAQLITDQLKRKSYKLVDINIATSGRSPVLYQRDAVSSMAMKSVAAPAIEAGEQRMQVTVSGTIELAK